MKIRFKLGCPVETNTHQIENFPLHIVRPFPDAGYRGNLRLVAVVTADLQNQAFILARAVNR